MLTILFVQLTTAANTGKVNIAITFDKDTKPDPKLFGLNGFRQITWKELNLDLPNKWIGF